MHAANDDVENRFSLPGAAAQYGPDRRYARVGSISNLNPISQPKRLTRSAR